VETSGATLREALGDVGGYDEAQASAERGRRIELAPRVGFGSRRGGGDEDC